MKRAPSRPDGEKKKKTKKKLKFNLSDLSSDMCAESVGEWLQIGVKSRSDSNLCKIQEANNETYHLDVSMRCA